MKIETKQYLSPVDESVTIAANFVRPMAESEAFQMAILGKVAQAIADKYVEEHYGEIAARLDQNAIANLAIADAGKKIAEEIRTRPVILKEPGAKITTNKFNIF